MTDPLSTDAVSAAMEAEFRLLDPTVRSSAEQLAELLHPDFLEVGTSGQLWDRESVIAALTARSAPAPRTITTSRMSGVQLAPDVVHLTFDTESGAQHAHRSSLWRLTGSTWLLYFHQGTRFGDEGPIATHDNHGLADG
ncbi:nuclear transport factor 2 family protein [Streptomyces sp. NPDC006208]|uniref:nuclear transport factor 2 family protein n=1 Tax=Streptomyces sp. NPDC006208 TaxID=3156734 RepID=UPI0033B993F3